MYGRDFCIKLTYIDVKLELLTLIRLRLILGTILSLNRELLPGLNCKNKNRIKTASYIDSSFLYYFNILKHHLSLINYIDAGDNEYQILLL
ncbi:hypothetical protein Swoo_2881 [Shewanella woodyi ATCC 51908]|uniref:Uncharacterized protein n=1 Tax=Shewanella woodyi (strain ATCC 51908 / MS32) TaxID=392500 RepID=B1KJW9_SHEWM|nr:hypothetical protein Swoo_2881 [Shewanella woodyi ATCC 51908]